MAIEQSVRIEEIDTSPEQTGDRTPVICEHSHTFAYPDGWTFEQVEQLLKERGFTRTDNCQNHID